MRKSLNEKSVKIFLKLYNFCCLVHLRMGRELFFFLMSKIYSMNKKGKYRLMAQVSD